ncbi:hypothetical protein TCAL_00389 [Tigriopus californicus]|uniref:Treslin STD domain-containing protein n=1 Tax=Tigriopus californicus TaxID=6832 RepID=A0A553NEM1_TIGCA|nr:uncharacterized protein LOC131888297 [Tigriopus californicus]TRY63892.1 hypothetical protein TCAL_00389 [Tigriopus californicus]|eukprot:TCALIF_00389-PA protein Name:"Protein of unknown function" AED:0.01 eAED:0.01 QI:0/1/0.75/1/1/1/8/0/1732
MPTQVIFLVDLDHLVPLLSSSVSSDLSLESSSSCSLDLTSLFERVHRLILRILCSFVSFQDAHLDRVESPQFDVKTFSSTGFFPPLRSGRWGFRDFREEHLETLMNELSSHFEQITETWFWPHSPQPAQYRRHLINEKRKCNAHQWFQALEEIALLYEWDRPDLESPVKKFNESQTGPKPAANLVYVLSKLPHDASEMGQFFGSQRDQWSSRDVFQQLFARKSAKTLTNVFKGDADVRVNIVDTGCLFESGGNPPLCLEVFQKALKTFKGQVIDFRRSLKSESIPCALNAWFLPQTEPFRKSIDAITAQENEFDTQTSLLVEALDQNFRSVTLPLPESSSANVRSGKRKWGKSPVKKNKVSHRLEKTKSSTSETRSVSSRGASLMRLGSQTFEKRQRSNNDADGDDPSEQPPASKRSSILTPVEKEADRERVKLEGLFKPYQAQSLESCLKILWECQVQALKRGDSDGMLVALAELTVSSLISCIKNNNSRVSEADEPPQSVEDVTRLNFLVGPIQVGQRKTSQTSDGRIRDHKLQALYRIELHRWSVSNRDILEEEILIHLRQISIWESPKVMFRFLTDCLTPTYLRDQPDLLCQIYDELNIERHESLPQLFSPSKRHCLSIAPVQEPGPSSVFPSMGVNSDVSINGLDEKLMKITSRKQLEKLNKRFENTRRQINLESKRSSLPRTNIAKGASREIGKLSRIQPTRAVSFPSSEKEVTSQKLRAKRNLCFESDSPPVPSTSKSVTASLSLVGKKSPRKKIISTPRKKATLSINHHKKRSRSATLSKLMTPRKRHQILAPETPSRKVKMRRKTDGVLSIKESPNVDAYKQRSAMTPRRTQASLDLRSKASFYAGKVSRNLMKASEKVAQTKFEASGIVYRSHGKSAVRGDPRTPPSADQNPKDRRSSWETFFPHLVKFSRPESQTSHDSPVKRLTPAQSAAFNTPKKNHDQTPRKSDSSRKVSFNTTPQAPTPKSVGKSNPKGILKTPHKDEARVGPSKMLFFDMGTPYKMPTDPNKTPLKTRNEIEVRKSPRQLLRMHREGLHSQSASSFHTPEKRPDRTISHTITSSENIENEKGSHNSIPPLSFQDDPEPQSIVPPNLDGVKSQVLFYSPTKPTKASFKEYESGPTPSIPQLSTRQQMEFPEDAEITTTQPTFNLSSMGNEKLRRAPRNRVVRQSSKSSLTGSSESESKPNSELEICSIDESGILSNCKRYNIDNTGDRVKDTSRERSIEIVSKENQQLQVTIPLVRLSKEELLEKYHQTIEEGDNEPLRKTGSVTVTSPVKVDLVKDITRKSSTACDRRPTRRRHKALNFDLDSTTASTTENNDKIIPTSVSSNEQSSLTFSDRYPSTCSSIGDEDIPDEIPKLVVSPSLLNDSVTKRVSAPNINPPDLPKIIGLPKPFSGNLVEGIDRAGVGKQLPLLDQKGDSDSSRRPSRRRISVNRFGIDDITLEEVFSSPSRKKPFSNATPSKNAPKQSEPITPVGKIDPSDQDVMVTPSPKRAKKRLRSMSSMPKLRCAHRVLVRWIFDGETERIQDIVRPGGQITTANSFSPTRGELCATAESPGPPKSPGKFWSVANITQSPRGEIKMKIQRTKKLQTNFVQRLSRSATMELGLSPGKLSKMIYQNSPSPKPKTSTAEPIVTPVKLLGKDEYSPHTFVTPRSLNQRSTKSSAGFSPLSSMGLFDLTKSPLVMDQASHGSEVNDVLEKRQLPRSRSSSRRVNKKLYNELM